ncbi:MAG: DNA repair protein RecO [Candidatus Anoxymicrobium japonicum]|uniref:DNA repair protein RecO n=1 Tax=Candidatus Anoxymicrobium japonicum TaxID=2013648 RepID=A0A2N3G7T9_9ACTN|nr:MAG: DNA repair protein RecO [Candidatus Anoxymicrobium japonicum]
MVELPMAREMDPLASSAAASRKRIKRGRPEYKDEGIVLRSYKLGESDKILRVFTRENGKRSAVARGVRKTSSRFGARVEPLTHTMLFLHRGRSMDTVKQVEILTSFEELREDLRLFVSASEMVELIDSITTEDEPNPRLFDLALLGLRLLKERPAKAGFTLAFFEFKVMGAEGFELMVGGCACCGGELEKEGSFSLRLGGLICAACKSGRSMDTGKLVRIDTKSVELMLWMASHGLGEWPEELKERTSQEMELLMGNVLEHWMEREFRSHRVARSVSDVQGYEY